MTERTSQDELEAENEKPLSRRKALVRLGLAAGITTYIAPLLTGLNQAAADDGHGGGGDNCPPGEHRNMGTCV